MAILQNRIKMRWKSGMRSSISTHIPTDTAITRRFHYFRTTTRFKMQISPVLAALSLPLLSLAVAYSLDYDIAESSTARFACNDCFYHNYPALGSIPSFPYVGGSSAPGVSAFKTEIIPPQCGMCAKLTYEDVSVFATIVDFALPHPPAQSSFVVSLATLDKLTHNHGIKMGRVSGFTEVVSKDACFKK